jgi:hypothetical protein
MPTKTTARAVGAPAAAAPAAADALDASALGDSLSGVWPHTGGGTGLGAAAYTTGSDIRVGPAQEKHLAHEAAHVVQQSAGRAPTSG